MIDKMIYKIIKKYGNKKGMTLFFAVVVIGSLLFLTLVIINTLLREMILSSYVEESQVAYYSAYSGAECLAYHSVVQTKLDGSDLYAILNSPDYDSQTLTTTIQCNDNTVSVSISGSQPPSENCNAQSSKRGTIVERISINNGENRKPTEVDVFRRCDPIASGVRETFIDSYGYSGPEGSQKTVERNVQFYLLDGVSAR